MQMNERGVSGARNAGEAMLAALLSNAIAFRRATDWVMMSSTLPASVTSTALPSARSAPVRSRPFAS